MLRRSGETVRNGTVRVDDDAVFSRSRRAFVDTKQPRAYNSGV